MTPDPAASPLVSVVIPAFNRDATIERAVASAFAQDGVAVEVIVVDDGSSDGTHAVLSRLEREFGPAFRFCRQRNAGASAARNSGLAMARGEYVQFLDSDDTVEPEKARLQLDVYLSDAESTVVLCQGWLETKAGGTRIGADLGSDPDSYLEAMCGRAVHVIQTSAPLWRRAYLTDGRRWDPSISLGDDLEFHTRCLADARRVGFVSRPLFTVHQHGGDRLSDFSADDGRLASLLATREAMHRALDARNRWTETCAANMAAAFRSIYAIYLQRMSSRQIGNLERSASHISGPEWRGRWLAVFALLRRILGPGAVSGLFALSLQARSLGRRLGPSVWRNRLRRLAGRISRFNLRDLIEDRRTLRRGDLLQPGRKRILFVEANEFHAETIPGYVSLFRAAGYGCSVLHRHGINIEGALSRLPPESRPLCFPLTLRAMARVLRRSEVGRYELIVFGSGTLAEKYGYFGGVLQYIGKTPQGRLGYLVIEHSATTLSKRRGWRQADPAKLFALRDMQVDGTALRMLAPVDFGPADPAPLDEPVVFSVIGRLAPEVRNVDALFAAVRILLQQPGPAFEVQLVGASGLAEVPQDIRHAFRERGRLPFAQMYDAIDRSHFLLPLLDARIASHRRYLTGNTTGTRQLSLGFLKPMIVDNEFACAYSFSPRTAVIHPPGDLAGAMQAARTMSPSRFDTMQTALKDMKADVFEKSLANFQEFLDRQEFAG